MMPLRFHSLWSINAPLDQARLCRQLDRFRAVGLDGVVFHPRFYPNDPPYLGERYMELVSAVILHAKSLGLAFWIYDENGWPSGTVGGQMLRQYPDLSQHWAGLVAERPARCLAEFERGGRRWYLAERIGAGVDYLNPGLATHFLALTHERYRTGLASAAFEYVEAFFCDEPEFGLGHAYDSLPPDGAIPWTEELPALYEARHGESLLPRLESLFFPATEAPIVRVRFWELLRDRFCTAFLDPLDAWCRTHGKLLAAHIKGEEHPLFQVPMVGSCNAVFRHLSLPGIDALERLPSNDYYPRQVATVAQQFGNGRCMVEAFGGAGWGATPEDLERYLLWLGRHGLTDFVMHLSQSRLDSAAIRDWPPSQPFHLNWAEAYPEVLRRVRTELAAHPPSLADTLVISPHRAVMAAYEPCELRQTNIHNAATYPDTLAGRINRRFLETIRQLHAAGVAYHVTDEATFEAEARPEAHGTRLGQCVYRQVIAAGTDWRGAIAVAKPETPAVPGRIVLLDWSAHPVTSNSLLLEPVPATDGWFVAEFVTAVDFPATALEVVFADTVVMATLEGEHIALSRHEDGTTGRLPLLRTAGTHVLRFRCSGAVRAPYAWLNGAFRVLSRTLFADGPNDTVAATGPFFLARDASTPVGDFVAAGYPFLRLPILAETTFVLPQPARRLRLCGVAADAARGSIDDRDEGWTWGPGWEITAELAAGVHRLRLELVPSTYNHFGPHHYYRGDAPLISPDQFTGRKNFADPADAPSPTTVRTWHFKPVRFPAALAVT